MRILLAGWLATMLAVMSAVGAEHHGVVKFGGLPVPGASVTASQAGAEKKLTAVTGGDGGYVFPDLADGTWQIQVEMLGFATVKDDVKVGTGALPVTQWDVKMLGFDEMKAMAPAPAPNALTTAAPVVTSENKTPAAAPRTTTKSRNAVKTAPGLAPEKGFQRADVTASNATPPPSDAAPQEAAASRDSSDSFAINGSANNGAASAFGTSAAFGNGRRGPGSLYNGTVGIVIGNAALDARNYSLNGLDTPKPGYTHLQAGGTFGGPLRLPHLRLTQPINFFVAYQLSRNTNANTVTTNVPTQAMRDGDLASQVIPQSKLNPVALALLKYYPLPNAVGAYNYQTALTGTTDSDSVQGRLSKNFGRNNQVFGTFGYQNTRGTSTNLFVFMDTNASTGWDITVNWSHRFGQRLFTTWKGQFNRSTQRATPFFANVKNVSGSLGITGNNQDPLNWGPPSLGFTSGIAGLSDGQASYNRFQTAAVSGNGYWSKSPHNVTFGGDYKKQQFNYLGQQNARGSFTFNGAASGKGNDFADFLTGTPDTSSIAFGNADKYFRSSLYDLYGTDDWRISPSFTLNIGARWEYAAPIIEKYGRLVNLDISKGWVSVAPVIANHPVGALTGAGYADSLLQPYKTAIQPRVGTAWRPIAGSSLVVRSGYGITYDTSVYQSIAVRMAQQSPLSKSLSVQNTAANPLTLTNGFIANSSTTPNTFAVDPNFKIGYTQTWNLVVQRDLPGSLVMTATYLGIKGTHAQQSFYPNSYPTGAVNPCAVCQSGYAFLTSGGNSTRQAGQFQLRRRLHNGFTATMQYVYSKSIDDAALGGRGQGGSLVAQNWLNLRGERGLSPFDQRHVMTLTTQYSTGAGKSGALLNGWRGAAYKDWTLTTSTNLGTGTPLSPSYPTVVQGTGAIGSIRPDVTGADLYAGPPGYALNAAAFRAPAAGQWGNAGRNSITGPNQFTLGAGMARTFQLRDRMTMDFRLDAVNVLNHVTFTSWNTSVTNNQFGLPVGANPMRSVTANVRVRF